MIEAPPKQQPPEVLLELRKIRTILTRIYSWVLLIGWLFILNMALRALIAVGEMSQK